MNIKNIAIVLTVLVVAIAAMLFMQKGNYVTQATEHYNKTTGNSFKGSSKIIEYVNSTAGTTKMLWALTCDAVQGAKTSQDMAKLEGKYFPATKGSNSISQKTRRFEPTAAYYIVTTFDKVDVDKKTDLKTLAGLKSIDVGALLGNATIAAAVAEDEDGEEEGEE
jgi:hypothetical protein